MKEYIERESVEKMLEDAQLISDGEYCGYCTEDINLSSIPAVDVAPVRHGRWIPSESDFDDDDTLFDVEDWCDWQCSVCHEDICYEDPMERRFLPKFCPNCGARMDKEDDHG